MPIPLKHHYLPIFYLKRWACADGRLCEFSRPHKEVIARRKHPSQTGYETRLYETKGVPPSEAQAIEQKFMQSVDTLAAEALDMLEAGDDRIHQESRPRSGWSRFIMSLLMRTPEDVSALRRVTMEEWARRVPGIQAKYEAERGPNDPATIENFLATVAPDEIDRFAMSLVPSLLDHHKIGQLINNMHWFVIRPPAGAGEILTSDRPVVMTPTLGEENAYIFLPIGPHALFVAAKDTETKQMISTRDPGERVEVVNRFVAAHAVAKVYARSDLALAFVQKHMSTQPRSSLLERLAGLRAGRIM